MVAKYKLTRPRKPVVGPGAFWKTIKSSRRYEIRENTNTFSERMKYQLIEIAPDAYGFSIGIVSKKISRWIIAKSRTKEGIKQAWRDLAN